MWDSVRVRVSLGAGWGLVREGSGNNNTKVTIAANSYLDFEF